MGRSKANRVAVCSNCPRLERRLADLEQELAELRRQVNRNSGNSSVPPSANPPWAPRPVKKKPTGRSPGGQAGHEGHHRVLLPPEQVDEVVRHVPLRCQRCGELAAQPGAGVGIGVVKQRHQVMELPARAVKVVEHQSIACRCHRCGHTTRQPIPTAVLGSVCGDRLSAAVTFVSARVHGSRRAVEEMLSEVLGARLSLGTVMARESEMTGALDQPYRDARAAVAQLPVKNVDETGWRGPGRYLWLAANQTLAVFHVDPCRNRDAMKHLLGEEPSGVICSDRFGVYDLIPLRRRALCWAHLKRDFQAFVDVCPAGEPPPDRRSKACRDFGESALSVVKEVTESWRSLKAGQISRSTLQRRLSAVRRRMKRLLADNLTSSVKRISMFCRGLLKREPAMWTFARLKGVDPTNNHAERMLRPAVCWRKTCLGSHSLAGCRFVERMLTVIQSLRLQGRSVMAYLHQAVHAWRNGLNPPAIA
jgi:transposase